MGVENAQTITYEYQGKKAYYQGTKHGLLTHEPEAQILKIEPLRVIG